MEGINFSYAAESTDISSVSNGGDGIFSSAVNLISSFLSWSIKTFGNTAGKILGGLVLELLFFSFYGSSRKSSASSSTGT